MSEQAQPPAADRPWSVERHGIDPVAEHERHGRPFELFWVWFAANLGILGIVYGGLLAASGLNLWQSLLVALVAPLLSFLLVGVLSLAGKATGIPMLTLSRASFGLSGNFAPTLISWLSLVGWETVSVITSAYALLGLFSLSGLPATPITTIVSLLLVAMLVVGLGLLGHATLVWIQRAATWVFGLFTLVIALFLLAHTNWSVVLSLPPAPWDSGVLAVLSIIMAGTGVSWVNAGADYTRYLPRQSSNRAIIGWTVLGSTLPLLFLIMTGFLLSTTLPNLASAVNPIQIIGTVLPSWMAIPYLLTALGGLIAAADLAIYSSGLNLLALGLKVQRYQAVVLDGVLMFLGAGYVMLIAQDFLNPFISFLQLLADALVAWAAVFLVDLLYHRRYNHAPSNPLQPANVYSYTHGVHWPALSAWVLGLLVALAFTVSPWFRGPLALGPFATGSMGYLLGFLVSALTAWLFFVWHKLWRHSTTRENL